MVLVRIQYRSPPEKKEHESGVEKHCLCTPRNERLVVSAAPQQHWVSSAGKRWGVVSMLMHKEQVNAAHVLGSLLFGFPSFMGSYFNYSYWFLNLAAASIGTI